MLEKGSLGRNLEIVGMERNVEVEMMHENRIEGQKNALVMGISVLEY